MPVLSQAAIAAADISAEERSVHVVLHSESYIPQRLLDQTAKEISGLYGLRRMNLTATHPASELQKIEPEELRDLFVMHDSMARGSLAGAKWEWSGESLTIRLAACLLIRDGAQPPVGFQIDMYRSLIQRINSDLANDLGNLLHRTLSMVGQFQQGVVLASEGRSAIDESLINAIKEFIKDGKAVRNACGKMILIIICR